MSWAKYSFRNLNFSSCCSVFDAEDYCSKHPNSDQRKILEIRTSSLVSKTLMELKELSQPDLLTPYVSGRSFIDACIVAKLVRSCSQSTREFPRILFNKSLTDLTNRSHQPPHHAAVGGLKIHLIRCMEQFPWIFFHGNFLKMLFVPTKLIPLSL